MLPGNRKSSQSRGRNANEVPKRESQSRIPRRFSNRSSSTSRASETKRYPSTEAPRLSRSKSTLGATPLTTRQTLLKPQQFHHLLATSPCNDRLLPSPRRLEREKNVCGSAVKNNTQRVKVIDNRPFNDKKWQQTQLAKIQQYVQRNPCKNANIDETFLRSLSINTFVEVCNLLLTKLDSKLAITKESYVEELPYILRLLDYPSVVKKSLMKSVNIPRNWPVAVGILSWLVELVEGAEFLDYESLIPGNEIFVTKFIFEAFHAWLQNTEVNIPVSTDQIYEQLTKIENLTVEEFDIVKNNIQELETKHAHLCEEETKLLEKQSIFASKKCNINTMEQKIIENQDLKHQTFKKIEQLKNNIAENEYILNNMRIEKENLYKKIQSQSVDKEKYLATKNGCSKLEQDIGSLNKLIDNLKECTYGEELKMKRNYERIVMLSEEFNKRCLSNITELNSFAVYDISLIIPNTHSVLLGIKNEMMKTWQEQLQESDNLDLEVIELAELKKKMKELDFDENQEIPKHKHQNEIIKQKIDETKKKIQNYQYSIEKLMEQLKEYEMKISEIENTGKEVAVQSEKLFEKMDEQYVAYGADAKKKLQNIYNKLDDQVNKLKEILHE